MTKKVIKFSADWCSPCSVYAPNFKSASELATDWVFESVNVDTESELASKYQIRSIPATIIEIDGKIVDRLSGVIPTSELVNKLNSYTAQPA
jgi:thioredoxin-like negative regulator of GroEL